MLIQVPYDFPDGYFTLQPHHSTLWSQSVNADQIVGILPSISVMIAFRGAGASISEVMTHLKTDAKNVLFGELAIKSISPLKLQTPYLVKMRLIRSERKTGRKSGVFDRVKLGYTIKGAEAGLEVSLVNQTWIIRRFEETNLAA